MRKDAEQEIGAHALRTKVFALSNREFEVLGMAAKGSTDKEIASQLGLSIHTVRTYWKRMHLKLEVTTKMQMIALLAAAPGERRAPALTDLKSGGIEHDLRKVFDDLPFKAWLRESYADFFQLNRQLRMFFGLETIIASKDSLLKLCIPGDRPKLRDVLELSVDQLHPGVLVTLRGKEDNRRHWVHAEGIPSHGNKQLLLGICQDIESFLAGGGSGAVQGLPSGTLINEKRRRIALD